MPLVLCTPAEAAVEIAAEILELVASRARAGRSVVLGLATGRTPLEIYAELARRTASRRIDLSNVVTFNLDEFLDLPPEHAQSFRSYMQERVVRPLRIDPARAHLPASDVVPSQADDHARAYERAIADAGGIDLQILGLGRNGHIGFNEPGSPRDSRTRQVELAETTRSDAAAAFGGLQHVPRRAITMGVATIFDARRVRLLAFGSSKHQAVRDALEAPLGVQHPATFLRAHPNLRLYVDAEALGPLRPGTLRP